jgi:hypothetical protein
VGYFVGLMWEGCPGIRWGYACYGGRREVLWNLGGGCFGLGLRLGFGCCWCYWWCWGWRWFGLGLRLGLCCRLWGILGFIVKSFVRIVGLSICGFGRVLDRMFLEHHHLIMTHSPIPHRYLFYCNPHESFC